MKTMNEAINVHNGTHTVSSPKGGHVTIKLHTAKKGALEGKRIISILIGPNNETDYTPVAFWNDKDQVANVWKKHKHPMSRLRIDGYHYPARHEMNMVREIELKLAIWASLAVREDKGYWYKEGYRLLLEGRCVVCNRKLTDPESIETGIGPVCAGR